MPNWNPEQYLKFEAERTRPAMDLAQRALTLVAGKPGMRILDIGCGPGNSTAVLARNFPGARITGLDSSPEMIKKAGKSGLEAEWVCADAEKWQPVTPYDLVFSNAMLQWIEDQQAFLAKIAGWLNPPGVLAVQVPGNGESPLHQALRRTAESPAWKAKFEGLREAAHYREPDYYHDALEVLGMRPEVWETTYWHLLENHRGLIEWYSGTGMRPWLDRLDEEDRKAFSEAVLASALPGYPAREDGTVFFPFRRVFFTAAYIPFGGMQ